VTRAVVGAGSALASLALVAGEALAVASLSVAKTSTGTLGVLVAITVLIRGINPGYLERANAIRAITAIVGKTKAPVVKAIADTIKLAGTVTRASVVATSLGSGNKRNQNTSSKEHY
jgi:hypothetical protein